MARGKIENNRDVDALLAILKGGERFFEDTHMPINGYFQATLIEFGFEKSFLKKLARKGVIQRRTGYIYHDSTKYKDMDGKPSKRSQNISIFGV